MIRLVALTALLALTACGVDGPPVAPATKAQTTPAISVSGDVRFGVTGGGNP